MAMFRRLASLAKSALPFARKRANDRVQTACDYNRWRKKAQTGELAFHRQDTWRPSENFAARNASLFERFQFRPDQYVSKTVIDVGAGSKLRTKFFQGAELLAVEPLADQFRSEIPWSDVYDSQEVYAVPAEEFIPACEGRCDLVISINVLDHCYDFAKIITNLRRYMRADGLMFLSFDKHDKTDSLHPLSLNEEICQQIFEDNGLSIERSTTGFGEGWDGPPTYGHGPYAMNFWLRRAKAA
jgi:2-polyprenyl-3-methyl-5-hydroxy-6-metoxy-1,4-benzoquinol methylase